MRKLLFIITASVLLATLPATKTQAKENYNTYINAAAKAYGICPELIEAMIDKESAGQADVVSSAGCVGLMQINPNCHKERMERLGVYDLTDPKQNILVGVDYLAELFDKYGELYEVLMVYNGGNSGEELYEKGHYTSYAETIAQNSYELERAHGK